MEGRRGITQPKQHTFTLIQAHTTQGEGSILFAFLSHRDLPESRVHVKRREMGSPSKTLQCLTDVGQRMRVFHSQRVELSEVNAEAERSILLSYQHNSITPWAVARSDHTSI